ncbi:MAG: sugar phosphate isomerase/epimerase, partial [Acetobacteraceae bacterium]|nr:sugar phosphate isomerase/epimerase [Acetobacteraceae bacterium]
FRLREAVGPVVGANLDPSHLFWMGADPLEAVRALGGATYHIHAKDTRINAPRASVHGLIDLTPTERPGERAWSSAGYDDVLSLEHEDLGLPPLEGVRLSVALLNEVF